MFTDNHGIAKWPNLGSEFFVTCHWAWYFVLLSSWLAKDPCRVEWWRLNTWRQQRSETRGCKGVNPMVSSENVDIQNVQRKTQQTSKNIPKRPLWLPTYEGNPSIFWDDLWDIWGMFHNFVGIFFKHSIQLRRCDWFGPKTQMHYINIEGFSFCWKDLGMSWFHRGVLSRKHNCFNSSSPIPS